MPKQTHNKKSVRIGLPLHPKFSNAERLTSIFSSNA